MLRMGKNPNEDKTEAQADAGYAAARSYTPYQSGESYGQPSTQSAATPKALTESESIAREIKDGTLSGFVGSGTNVTGEASFKSMLRIDGRFSGRITSSGGTLIVGAGGQVEANIEVAVATIQGIVNGDVIASDRIELGRASKLQGNIQTPSLIIEQGAVFEGSCKMTQQKTAAETSKVERKSNVIDSPRLEPAKVADALNKKLDEGAVKKPEVAATAH
ncbi:MAG TPA: polymer-forming cytoskeletal protein [Pyrinomonadaceae bacterium]|nr:polymer-forming cytoskeletal protein [Pyrinomonadaceae bacterium]